MGAVPEVGTQFGQGHFAILVGVSGIEARFVGNFIISDYPVPVSVGFLKIFSDRSESSPRSWIYLELASHLSIGAILPDPLGRLHLRGPIGKSSLQLFKFP